MLCSDMITPPESIRFIPSTEKEMAFHLRKLLTSGMSKQEISLKCARTMDWIHRILKENPE